MYIPVIPAKCPAMNYLVINFLGDNTPTLPRDIAQTVKECRCNIINGHLTVMGKELTGMLLLSGTWDAIAKMENMCARLEDRHKIRCILQRTGAPGFNTELLPYAVEVVSIKQPGVVYDLCEFFIRNSLVILELHTNNFKAQHTGTDMSSLHISVGMPANLSIAALRSEFIDLCDRLNIDAIMEPMK